VKLKISIYTRLVFWITLLVLLLSLPGSLRDAYDRGGLYLFSRAFFEDLPSRLTGPGRLRFLLQPAMSILLGVRAGRSDAAAGLPPFVQALLLHGGNRAGLVGDALRNVGNLVLIGITLDAVSQWLILGVSHPGAALVVGPVLIAVPYSVARALANRANARHD
jgi:hypothetical protein